MLGNNATSHFRFLDGRHTTFEPWIKSSLFYKQKTVLFTARWKWGFRESDCVLYNSKAAHCVFLWFAGHVQTCEIHISGIVLTIAPWSPITGSHTEKKKKSKWNFELTMRTKNKNKKHWLTIYQARIGLFQLQNNVNHRLQEWCVSAIALGMRQ